MCVDFQDPGIVIWFDWFGLVCLYLFVHLFVVVVVHM